MLQKPPSLSGFSQQACTGLPGFENICCLKFSSVGTATSRSRYGCIPSVFRRTESIPLLRKRMVGPKRTAVRGMRLEACPKSGRWLIDGGWVGVGFIVDRIVETDWHTDQRTMMFAHPTSPTSLTADLQGGIGFSKPKIQKREHTCCQEMQRLLQSNVLLMGYIPPSQLILITFSNLSSRQRRLS